MFAGQPYKIDQIEKLSSGEEDEHGESGAEPVSTCPSTATTASPTCAAAPTWSARARSRPMPSSCSASRAPTGAATSTSRCCSASMARSGRRSRSCKSTWLAGRGREARPPQAGQGPGPVQLPRGRRRRAGLLASQGRPHPAHHRGLLAQRALRGRLRDRLHAAHRPRALWETSGHLDFYSENMYSPMDIDGRTTISSP
jgi:hypothetical protein